MRCEMTAPIIEQKAAQPRPQRVGERPPVTLPDFRNLGVMLRILVLANAMGLAATLVKAPTPQSVFPIALETAALLEPLLLLQVLLLIALGPTLRKLPYALGCTCVLLSTVVVITFAQEIDQREARLDLRLVRLVVDGEGDAARARHGVVLGGARRGLGQRPTA